MSRPPRIALFGGTFDPIHAGHLRAARIVGRRLGLDRIFFIPASLPPHKARSDMAPAADRYRMVRLAVTERAGWTASPIEIRAGGTSWSIRTIESMRRRFPRAKLFFIAGADAFREIKTWREWRKVLQSCVFVVIARPGVDLDGSVRGLDGSFAGRIRRLEAGRSLRPEDLEPGRILLLPIAALPVSSTAIRARVRRGGTLRGVVPPVVAAYILKKGLYRMGPGRPLPSHHPPRRLRTHL